MYNRGTLEQFNAWHENVMALEGIIPNEGKVGDINGVPAPQSQRTVAYSKAVAHPVNPNDYIWVYGDYPDAVISVDEARTAGWFAEE